MKNLQLNVKKKWFDRIKSGEKNIEYREKNPYWTSRLCLKNNFKIFDKIIFKNGYRKNAPTIEKEFIKITLIHGANTDLNIKKEVYAIHFK